MQIYKTSKCLDKIKIYCRKTFNKKFIAKENFHQTIFSIQSASRIYDKISVNWNLFVVAQRNCIFKLVYGAYFFPLKFSLSSSFLLAMFAQVWKKREDRIVVQAVNVHEDLWREILFARYHFFELKTLSLFCIFCNILSFHALRVREKGPRAIESNKTSSIRSSAIDHRVF